MAATPLYPVSGSKFYIGSAAVAAKGTVTAADFTGVTWLEIDGWTSAGELGDTQEVVEQDFINQRRTRKAKGSLNGGTFENTFVPIGLDPGQVKFKEAIDSCFPYPFKVEWGANCAPTSTVTISQATPGVVTWTAHGLLAGQPVVFSTTGGLPAGLTAGVTYYVLAAGLTANAFTVSATPGGTAIATTTAGTGTHTAVASPLGQTDLFFGLALPGPKQGGESNTPQLRTFSVAVDSNILEV